MKHQMKRVIDDDFDEDGILKDGHSYRVPMRFADSNNTTPRRTLDASTCRPGFRTPTNAIMTDADVDKAYAARDLAYRTYDFIARNAWRGPDADTAELDRLYDAEIGDDNEDDMVFTEVSPQEFIAARNNVHGGKRGEHHPRTGFGEHALLGPQVGDICTCRGPEFPSDVGDPGTWQKHDGRMVCVPNRARINKRSDADAPRRNDTRTVTRDFSAVDAEYQRYNQTISGMWRSPK